MYIILGWLCTNLFTSSRIFYLLKFLLMCTTAKYGPITSKLLQINCKCRILIPTYGMKFVLPRHCSASKTFCRRSYLPICFPPWGTRCIILPEFLVLTYYLLMTWLYIMLLLTLLFSNFASQFSNNLIAYFTKLTFFLLWLCMNTQIFRVLIKTHTSSFIFRDLLESLSLAKSLQIGTWEGFYGASGIICTRQLIS